MKTTSTRRPAFTLVEMLVVILIMSILVTLVTLGVTRAMRFASEVGTKTEMAQIEQALGVAALDLGRVPYIPSYLKLLNKPSDYAGLTGKYDLMSRRLLSQMFPDWSDTYPANWGGANGKTLDASQAFIFILGGVQDGSNNCLGFAKKGSPTDTTSPNRKGPYFNFNPARIDITHPNGNGCYRYKDYWNNDTTFLTVYSDQMISGETVTSFIDTPPSGPGRQYQKPNVLYMPKGYQIFAAGKDGKWGTSYPTPGGAFNGLLTGDGEDDQCNFSESPLGKPIND